MIIFGKFSRTLVVGKSASGKSVLVNRIIEKRNQLYAGTIQQVLYISPQPVATITAPNVKFLRRVPDKIPPNSLVIVDDAMLDVDILKRVCQLAIRDIHHSGSHLILIVQRLYVDNPHYRVIVDQMTHILLFKLTKGFHTLSRFVRDVFPSSHKEYFWSAYHQATSRPYSYLLVDVSGDAPQDECLYSDICGRTLIYKKK